MIKKLPILALGLTIAFGSAAYAGCARLVVSGADQTMPAKGALNQGLLERALLAEVNYRRCRIGRDALSPISKLREPARNHSAWMAGAMRLSHRSSVAGRATPADRVRSAGLRPRAYAENLAQIPLYNLTPRFRVVDQARCRFVTPGGRRVGLHSYASFAYKVVALWMESPGHRRNLVSRKTTHLASAAVVNPRSNYCGDIFVTQIFVG